LGCFQGRQEAGRGICSGLIPSSSPRGKPPAGGRYGDAGWFGASRLSQPGQATPAFGAGYHKHYLLRGGYAQNASPCAVSSKYSRPSITFPSRIWNVSTPSVSSVL